MSPERARGPSGAVELLPRAGALGALLLSAPAGVMGRRGGKKIYVYVTTSDGSVRSNRMTIP